MGGGTIGGRFLRLRGRGAGQPRGLRQSLQCFFEILARPFSTTGMHENVRVCFFVLISNLCLSQAIKETGWRFRDTVLAYGGGKPPLEVRNPFPQLAQCQQVSAAGANLTQFGMVAGVRGVPREGAVARSFAEAQRFVARRRVRDRSCMDAADGVLHSGGYARPRNGVVRARKQKGM